MPRCLVALTMCLPLACGTSSAPVEDAGGGRPADAATATIDAGIGAVDAAAAGTSRAAISAGGRVQGGSLVVDVVLSPPPVAEPITSAAVRVTTGHPIAP